MSVEIFNVRMEVQANESKRKRELNALVKMMKDIITARSKGNGGPVAFRVTVTIDKTAQQDVPNAPGKTESEQYWLREQISELQDEIKRLTQWGDELTSTCDRYQKERDDDRIDFAKTYQERDWLKKENERIKEATNGTLTLEKS